MELFIADWLNLIFRWLHLITGIAWIGTSFYFIFLDLSLRKKRRLPEGVGGEAWNVHGGGFYLMQKYTVAPEELPEELHWFKYEAYFTFLSGFALMGVIYYWGADSYLIDKEVANLSQFEAIIISIGFLAGGWIVYDILCRIPIFVKHSLLLSIAVFCFILVVAWATNQVFSSRAAFVRVGGSKAQREETSAKRVKSQRQLLRDWGSVPENAKILEEYAANNKEEKARRQAKATGRETYAGGGTNALGLTEDIAALLEAELEAEEGEEGEEGDEEGEEGEEGEELDA